MPSIALSLANVADDAAWNFRTERLPLIGINNAFDAFFFIFRIVDADSKRVGNGFALEDTVATELGIEAEEVAEVIVVEGCFANGIEPPMSFFAKETEVANRSIVEIDALQVDDGVLFEFFIILFVHLRGTSIERSEVFARKETEFELRVEVLEQLGRTFGML